MLSIKFKDMRKPKAGIRRPIGYYLDRMIKLRNHNLVEDMFESRSGKSRFGVPSQKNVNNGNKM